MASPIGNGPPPDATPPRTPAPPAPGPPPAAPTGASASPSREVPRPRPAAGAERGTPVLLPEGWVGKATDKIVSTVDGVRAKTTTPIEKVGRAIVWGLLVATAAGSLLVVLVIGGLRLLYEAVGNIPGIDGEEGRSVWIIDVLFGVGLILLGLSFIKKGTRPRPED